MTVDELARKVAGEVDGDGALDVGGLASLAEAKAGDVSFLVSRRYEAAMASTAASAVLVEKAWSGEHNCTLIRVDSADRAFAMAARILGPEPVRRAPGVHPSAVVADDVQLGEGVSIGPWCVLESGVRVGERTVVMAGCFLGQESSVGSDGILYPHVSVRERTRIGDRVIIHNGAVIGSDGFGYVPGSDGSWMKIPQIGTVEIGNDVEIGANVTIDRARLGTTVIGNGVKIDNLVQVAHNVRIGDHSAIAAQVGIAGSSSVGKQVRIGGQGGVSGHLNVGDGAVVGGRAGVLKDVPAGEFVSGYPAMPHSKARRAHAHLMRLPELKQRVAEIEKELAELKQRVGEKE